MADQEVKTSIDALVAYLNEHGETDVTAVAHALGVNESVILGWANVLEKANILRIIYKGGRAFLSPVTGLHAGTAVERSVAKAESAHLEEELDSQIAVVNQVSARIEEFSRGLLRIDELFRTKYKGVKDMLDRVNRIEGYIEGVEKKMEKRTAHIKSVSEKAQADLETVQKYLASLSGITADTNNARAVSQDLHGQLEAYDRNIGEMSKSLESVIYQYRKNALEISRKIRERHDELAKILEFEDNQIDDYEKSIAEYKRASDAAIRHTGEAGRRVLDELTSGTNEIARLSKSVNSSMSELRPEVDNMKRDLGSIGELNSGLVGIKKDLDEVGKERDVLLDKLKRMKDDARILSEKRAVQTTSAESIRKKSAKVTESVGELNGKLNGVGDKFRALGNGKGEKVGKENGDGDSDGK
ncbi:MAG: hypothetical protein M1569_01250 [Candidatus Marsarchaeota archaeon]|nr:hypothetical protein [Candidatus Marsarchaeota archaeon]MCL5413015.1 hypothetical protein [Candidatus Marsarchaeota archaeon]